MASVGSSNISFEGLKNAYLNGGEGDASGNSSFNSTSGTKVILSWFRNAGFTNDTTVPSATAPPAAISIGSHFRNKTFGEASDDGNGSGSGGGGGY